MPEAISAIFQYILKSELVTKPGGNQMREYFTLKRQKFRGLCPRGINASAVVE